MLKTTPKQANEMISWIKSQFREIDIQYFFDVWDKYWETVYDTNVVIFDMGIPDIFVRTLWEAPYYLFGAIYESDKKTQEIFPQISDPIVKATFSMLSHEIDSKEEKYVIAPVHNISARKALAYIDELGYSTISLQQDGFSYKNNKQFIDEQERFLLQLQTSAKKIITIKNLRPYIKQSTQASKIFKRLNDSDLPTLISTFIRQTYYMVSDIKKWNHEANLFLERIKNNIPSAKKVGLYGSPIYYPNSKIPIILHELGISHYKNLCSVPTPCDYSLIQENNWPQEKNFWKALHGIHYEWIQNTLGHLSNPSEQEIISSKGVVFHLLKGQLLYAYQAEQIEKICIENGVPFVCVETDYVGADAEQIRIRLEAFSELIGQSVPTE